MSCSISKVVLATFCFLFVVEGVTKLSLDSEGSSKSEFELSSSVAVVFVWSSFSGFSGFGLFGTESSFEQFRFFILAHLWL